MCFIGRFLKLLFNTHPGHKMEFSDLDNPEFVTLARPVNT